MAALLQNSKSSNSYSNYGNLTGGRSISPMGMADQAIMASSAYDCPGLPFNIEIANHRGSSSSSNRRKRGHNPSFGNLVGPDFQAYQMKANDLARSGPLNFN